jgi:predicted lysophospholipase L1 biosynthesis ABC-type transport system permease subunit
MAGLAAAVLGDGAAALVIDRVFHTQWHFLAGMMVLTVLLSILALIVLGFISTERALRQPAAPRLRMENGG